MTKIIKWVELPLALVMVIGLAACAVNGPKTPVPEDANLRKLHQVYARFYNIDDQNFKEFTCTISSPFLQNAVRQIRGELAGLTDKVSVMDTLDQHKIVYVKQASPHISDPNISIHMEPDVKIPNPAMFQRGVATMTTGFSKMVAGIDNIVLVAFKSVPRENFSDLNVLYVTTVGDTDNFSFTDKQGKVQVTGSISPTSETRKAHFGNVSITEKAVLFSTDSNKLLRASADNLISSPGRNEHVVTKIDYQKIGTLELPSHIHTSISVDTLDFSHAKAVIEISLNNCKAQ